MRVDAVHLGCGTKSVRGFPYASAVAGDEHYATSFPVLVTDGRFVLQLDGLKPDTYELRVATLQVNGGVVSHRFRLEFDKSRVPCVTALNSAWLAERSAGKH